MSRWSDIETEPEEKPNQVEFEGTYNCSTCNERVYRAIYLPDLQILTWKCENGHKSYIEKFVL